MAKFVKNNSIGKLEVCIRRTSHERSQDCIRNVKVSQSRLYLNDKISEDWVKVVFNDAPDFDAEWIRQELQKAASGPNYELQSSLQIFNFRVSQESAIVFIKLSNISLDAFKRNCNKIPHPTTGRACDVVVLTSEIPEIPVNLPERWIACIKETLTQRYNADEKSLNLSRFDEDTFLNNQGLWLSLTRPVIVRAIATLLRSVENITLNNLNMSNNNLSQVTHIVPIFEAVPVLAFDISDNSVVYRSLLRLLSFATHLLSMTMYRDTGMSGQKLKNKQFFIKEILENCQTLELFNGEDLRTDIFGGRLRLPASKQSTGVADKLMMDFFTDHAYKLETNRDVLVDYYSSDSVLNIAICYHDLSINNRRFTDVYMRNSRNLQRLKDENRRYNYIKHGSAQILGFLSEIPRLKHIPASFCLDVIVNTDESKIFSVNGLFVECCKITHNRNRLDNRDQYIKPTSHNYFNMRMFSRALIVVPPGKILQENWTITNPTDVQFRKYRQQFEDLKTQLEGGDDTGPGSEAGASSRMTDNGLNGGALPSSSSTGTFDQDQRQRSLVEALCQYSGMNASFSSQCLQETQWNIEAAKDIFQQAFNNGKIPKEAFLK